MVHLATILCLIIFSLFLSGYSSTAVAFSEERESSFAATVTVTDSVLNTVSPLIFGDNIEWVNDGMGIWLSQEKRFDDRLVEELRSAGIAHLRYPGGTLSDYFDWYKAVGEERQPITNPFADHKKQYPHFGPEEYMMLCRELGIPGTITFNAGTGAPEDAAGWVKYLNDKDFQVTAFAVGNEIYMAKPEEPIAKTVEEYMDFYLKCKEAIDAMAPDVKRDAAVTVNIGFDSFRIESSTTLTSDSYKDENTPEEPDNVVPVTEKGDGSSQSGAFTTVLLRHSLTAIDITKM